MQNSYEPEGEVVDEACWKGYKARGMKKKGGKLVPNCKPIGEEGEIVQELFGNKKYPYGKATKKNPRGKRDQAELDRAQAYIKKNPNFGKKKLKEDAPTMSVGTGGFSGSADEKGPVAGYDPLLKMMNRWKKAKTYPNKMADVVNRGKNGR